MTTIRILAVSLILFLSATLSHAESKAPSPAKSTSSSGGGQSFGAIGAGYGTASNIGNAAVTDLPDIHSFFIEGDATGSVLDPHFAINGFAHQNGTATLVSRGSVPTDFYFTMFEIGATIRPNTKYLTPFVGGGYIGGNSTVSDPGDRNVNNHFVVADRDSKWANGTYYGGGLDLYCPGLYGHVVGVRVSYNRYSIKTDVHGNLPNDGRLSFDFDRAAAGLLLLY